VDIWMFVAPAAAALSAALGTFALMASWRLVPPDDPHWRERPPAILRPVWAGARALGHHVAPLAPVRYRTAVLRRLHRAEFGRAATADMWVGATLAYAGLGAIAGALLSTAAGLDVLRSALAGGVLGLLLPEWALRDAIARRERLVQRELPTYLDVVTLAVESGCSLVAAVGVATEKAHDGPLRRALLRFLAELRAGRSRADALRSLDEWVSMPAMTSLVGALLQAERSGARLGDVLRAQSAQRTNERFARAEKLAMQAPVKMLGPLILCIFPCTFLMLGFPIGMKLSEGF
jgi:tight adherence protein C